MLKKVAVGDMVMYMNRHTPVFEGIAIITKTNLYGYTDVVEVEWITGGKGRGSVNLQYCKILGLG